MSNPDWLERAARRSQGETWMLGHTFERYQQLEGRSREELAKELGCTLDVLHWMSLCRRPAGQGFDEQVSAIAKRFEVELLLLVQVLRRVEVMDAHFARQREGEGEAAHPIQLAARDRSEDEETDS